MPITWDYLLIAASVLVAIVGSFTAMLHADNMRRSTGEASWVWMATGGLTLGLAIWSMHFIGMLAFHLASALSFDQSLTLLSAIPAITAALLGFFVVNKPAPDKKHLIGAGIVMGLGISAMHYTGMAAIRMEPPIHYNPMIVAFSIMIAMTAAWSALLMMCRGEETHLPPMIRLGLGSIAMGLAISGMHYTAMAGISIAPGSICLSGPARIDRELLAIIISIIAVLWFIGGMIATGFHRHISKLNIAAKSMANSMTRELRESEEKMRAVIDAALDCIITIDQAGQITHFNPAAESTFGYRSQDVMGRSLADIIIPPVFREPHQAGMRHFLTTGEARVLGKRLELTAMRADGSEFPAELTITQLNSDGPPQLAGFLRDITDRKRAEEEIHNLAFYDPLTQLPNRRLMRDRLQHALSACARRSTHGAILFIDLDNFKTLNDTRGHDIGDQLLVEVTTRLSKCIRMEDTVARLGGDEFVVVLEDLHTDVHLAAIEAEQVVEKLCGVLGQPYQLQGFDYHNTCSIGIALFSDTSTSVDELLKRADSAMYEAKRAGRNTLRFFDPNMQAELEKRASLENDLRHALNRNQLELYYQPQVNETYQIVGAEVLLRWNHPELGLISPLQFIPIAEETGLILPIGAWVLEHACRQIKTWEANPATRELELAVNVSARQFRHPDFVNHVRQVLQKTEVAPNRLKLELTESLVLDNVEDSIRKMEVLRKLGIRFSMDDFGTGYSSLAYIKRLPLSQLKIDQSFVRDIAQDINDAVIVQTILGMARNLGLSVIAEGVETSEQLGYLQNYGCPAFQGYLFGKPMPYEAFIATSEASTHTPLFQDATSNI